MPRIQMARYPSIEHVFLHDLVSPFQSSFLSSGVSVMAKGHNLGGRRLFKTCLCRLRLCIHLPCEEGNRRTVHPAELIPLSLTASNKLLSILVSDASVYSKIFVFIWCCLAGPRILQLHAGCLITHFLKVIKLRTNRKSFAVQSKL